jgi:hypothetical protein
MNDQDLAGRLRNHIRRLLFIFTTALVVSGLTAFPIEAELAIAQNAVDYLGLDNAFSKWLEQAYVGIRETNAVYPFISYGTDWLAFAHLVIAIVFLGPLKDPVRNIWVIEFGMIACMAVLPLAFIAGMIREIPLFWQMLDSMFGLLGLAVLLPCYIKIKKLEKLTVAR